MEMNIDMFRVARQLPTDIWTEYDDRYVELAERIRRNVAGELSDLPQEFLASWRAFMDRHGYDGNDQLFVSSVRYHEKPEVLLAKIRHNIGDGVPDPSIVVHKKLRRRQQVQEEQLAAAGCWSRESIRKRNLALDEIMWIRNAPKLALAEVFAGMRTAILSLEAKLLAAGRLDEAGDIFHLKVAEVDEAMRDPDVDLRRLIAPRKNQYCRARQSKQCPYLVDSRCRILKPNVKHGEPGTIVGAAISPGVAEGTVRVLMNPTERLEPGEILATVVTDPAWTPLFVGCSAVILQVGGALQHGALCAREYGKPAVSGIDVLQDLETGMRVRVDGNTGIVTLLDGGSPIRKMSRSLSSVEGV